MNKTIFEPAASKGVLSDHIGELLAALDHIFLSVVKLELNTGKAWLLQQQGRPQNQAIGFNWENYIQFASSLLVPGEAAKFSADFSTANLHKLWETGSERLRTAFACLPQSGLDWLEVGAYFIFDQNTPMAYILVRQSGDNHLLQRIIDLYVYSVCDYFIYLDAKNNCYTMFSASKSGTPLPPAVCSDYSSEIVKYAKAFVVPEDQEMVIQEMRLERVIADLDQHGVHAFTCGVWEEGVGYTRKRLEYRYYDRAQQMILLARTDITTLYEEQQRQTQALEEALKRAQTDPLTGLLNYQGIQEVVKLGPNQHAAMFFLDLDNFKSVNDTYGHAAGDAVLKAVADVLRKNIRSTDHAARIGGDEFVVFLNSTSCMEDAVHCAQRICNQLPDIQVADTDIQISGSIGVAIAPEDGTDYASLVKNADFKVYKAKSGGKNQFAL